MKKHRIILFSVSLFLGLFFAAIITKTPSSGQTNTPIDGVCGILSGQTLQTYGDTILNDAGQSFNINNSSLYCSQGLFDDYISYGTHFNNTISQSTNGTYRTCKSPNGGNSVSCNHGHSGSLQPINSTYNFSTQCGSASGQSFSTTEEIQGDSLSNVNNTFIGNLCKNSSGAVSIPGYFTKDALGRKRYCPTAYSNGNFDEKDIISCRSYIYQNASCGIAANTGHSTIPTSNLCAPGTVGGSVSFDNQTNLRGWSCSGNGGGNPANCTARLNGPNTFAPMCNNAFIEQPNTVYSYNHINSFPGSNACTYGVLSNRTISAGGIGTRQCSNNNQTSGICGNVAVINASINGGDVCNSIVNGNSFDNTYQLFQNNLCSNGGFASSLTTMSDRWRWKCGAQTCEATMTTKSMCGRASQQPRRSHPTSGVCTSGIASTIKKSNGERGRICTTNTTNIQKFNNSACTSLSCTLDIIDFYSGKTAICTAPRIVDGQCKRETQINTEGYSLPDEVLQAGLCEDGIPETLIPLQDTISKKRKRKCKAPNNLGEDSPNCYAKVKLPSLTVRYISQIVNGSVNSVVAKLEGFDPIYVSFDNPIGQYYRLFTQNGYFYFNYRDRAGNTGSTLAVVESIESDLPTATINYTPSTATTGFVTIGLTGFNRSQIPNVTFSGSCLTTSTSYGTGCVKNIGIHPDIFTITFRENLSGEFILVDSLGVTNTIPVSITNIDRTPPVASIQYSNPYPTNTGVVATLINPNEKITVTNNNGSMTHIFEKNGSFNFIIKDAAGNTSSINANVNRINKNAPSASVNYSTTGSTQDNVLATLTNFSTPGTIVTNNSGQITHLFTHNSEFIFLLKDPAGNIGSVIAQVENINKPIIESIISNYESKLCPQRTPTPIDTQAQIYNYHIQTMINNCIMKSQQGKNKYWYFYPRKSISRGEFITAVGRMIALTTHYSGSLVNTLSSNYIGSTFEGIDESNIAEADAWGLLVYSNLEKNNKKRKTDLKKPMSATEGQQILADALSIIGNETELRYLIKNKGNISRAQASYAIGTILSQYNNTALGNNHLFHIELNKKLKNIKTASEKRIYTLNVIKKTKSSSSQSLRKLGIDRKIVLQDLNSIALGTSIDRKLPEIIDLQTSIDSLVRENKPSRLPTNNTDKTYKNSYFNFWEGL